MSAWLIQDEVGQAIADARTALGATSAAEARAYEAEVAAREPRKLRAIGSTAHINVEGTLTQRPDFFASLFGDANTTYAEIQSALAAAAADPAVKDVVLNIDSPGGSVDGLFETLEAVRAFRDGSGKGLSVRASKAASAAYAIAAMAGSIEATSPSAVFGSIGVAMDYRERPNTGSITNTGSPNKRPDLSTEEGRAVVREHLDAINELFVSAIASGRAVDASVVSEGFGQGAVYLAAEAKRRNMIDRAPGAVLRAVQGPRTETHKENQTMDLNTLKAEHPGVFSAVLALGHEQGEAAERERVCAHLRLGEASGAMTVAHGAIKDGAALSLTLQSEYMAAGLNRRDQSNRTADDSAAAAALGDTAPAATQLDMQDRIAARLYGGAN